MEKVIGTLAEQFMADNPGVTITYDATGSGTGVECARNGSADIGLASRALKADEAGLESITVALDGIAIIVNEECGVDDLSLEQVTAIFKGEITMAEAISKTALVDQVAEAAGVNKKDTKAVIDALLATVTEDVKNDKEVRLIGFGTFKKAHRAARKGRNPQTGAEIEIKASDSLSFKSSVKY